MGEVHHQCAKTPHSPRAEIPNTDATVAESAERYPIHCKTLLQWKHREGVEDAPMGPKQGTSVLCELDEVLILPAR